MSMRSGMVGCLAAAVLLGLVSEGARAETRELSVERYVDKCRGAWVGQMIGVTYGAPYEFRSNGKPITEPLREWQPGQIAGAIGQDDCYVEMTFLDALERHGLDITFEEAGRAFAASEYRLWHANNAGRENIRRGILPPMSGHPRHNRHADDIDFQIEADLFGILCPGLPQESNRLCDVFGHIMNYGDGVYGGMFVAGMYAAAYFEDEDVGEVVRRGLACIPTGSQYHHCISDVVLWHDQQPTDWLATWQRIEEKWQDDVDCTPGNPFNIDAKLNGAYIVMGLLYGAGDLAKTIEIATRCGQDADCNPSNAAGVLGCMKGFSALDARFTAGVAEIEETDFVHTRYSLETLVPACRRMSEDVIRRAGGEVRGEVYAIPIQEPRPPATLEQWVDQEASLLKAVPDAETQAWNPDWRVVACGHDMGPGLRSHQYGRDNVLVIHPVDAARPAVLEARLPVPDADSPALELEVASDERGDFVLKVLVNGQVAHEGVVDTAGSWQTISVDLSPYAGSDVDVRIENHADDWAWEAAYLHTVRVQ